MAELDEQTHATLIETLARSQALMRRLLDNDAVFRAISVETLGELQAIANRQQQLLATLRGEGG